VELGYVPTGYLTLRQCVDRVARLIDPAVEEERSAALVGYLEVAPVVTERSQTVNANNRARAFGRGATGQVAIPNLTAEQVSIIARRDAAEAQAVLIRAKADRFLRQLFGDGKLLTLSCQASDVELIPIHAARWRTDTALAAFKSGKWPNGSGKWSGAGSGAVLVREVNLEAILSPAKAVVVETTVTSAEEISLLPRWMTASGFPISTKRSTTDERVAPMSV